MSAPRSGDGSTQAWKGPDRTDDSAAKIVSRSMTADPTPSAWLKVSVRVRDVFWLVLIEFLCVPATLRRRWGK